MIRRFAKLIDQDFESSRAALQTPYVNGMVEGHVNRRKSSETPDVRTCRLSTASRACVESLFLHTRRKSGAFYIEVIKTVIARFALRQLVGGKLVK